MNKLLLQRGIFALGVSLTVAITAIAPASFAQPQPLPGPQYQAPQYPPPPPNAQYPNPDQYRSGRGFDRGTGDRRGAENRIDRRLAFLHQRLGITPAQEAAWTQFASEVRATEAQPPDPLDRERGAAGSVVQRLELRERVLEQRSADLDRVVRALRPLYASLSDEQKRTADQLLFRPEQRPGVAASPGFRNGARPGFGGRTSG